MMIRMITILDGKYATVIVVNSVHGMWKWTGLATITKGASLREKSFR